MMPNEASQPEFYPISQEIQGPNISSNPSFENSQSIKSNLSQQPQYMPNSMVQNELINPRAQSNSYQSYANNNYQSSIDDSRQPYADSFRYYGAADVIQYGGFKSVDQSKNKLFDQSQFSKDFSRQSIKRSMELNREQSHESQILELAGQSMQQSMDISAKQLNEESLQHSNFQAINLPVELITQQLIAQSFKQQIGQQFDRYFHRQTTHFIQQPIPQEYSSQDYLKTIQQNFIMVGLEKPEQYQFLKNLFKKPENSEKPQKLINPDKAISRRLRPLSKKALELSLISQNTMGQFNYIVDCSQLIIKMNEFCSFAWANVAIFMLENCGIGDDGFKCLSRNITKYTQVRKIFLADNKIHNVSKQQLQPFAKQMKEYLTVVNLQRNPLQPDSIDKIIETQQQYPQIKFFNLQVPNKKRKVIKQPSFEGGHKSYEDSKQDPILNLSLIPQDEKQEVLRRLSPSFSPKNIRSSLAALLRCIQSTSMKDIFLYAIKLLLELKIDYHNLSVNWFLDKIGYGLKEQIYLQEVNFVQLFRQVQQIMNQPVNSNIHQPIPIQLKVIEYLFSELIMSVFCVIGIRNETNLHEQLEIPKRFIKFAFNIMENCIILTLKQPANADQQARQAIETAKQQAIQKIIDGVIDFLRFFMELAQKLQKQKQNKQNKRKNQP